jgi:hypothetical protein
MLYVTAQGLHFAPPAPPQHSLPLSLARCCLLLLLLLLLLSSPLDRPQPAQVRGSEIKSTSTNSGAYSNLKLEWPRPNDSNKPGGPPSCITAYEVKIIRVSHCLTLIVIGMTATE